MILSSRNKNTIAYIFTVIFSILILFIANKHVSSGESVFHGSSNTINRAVVKTIVDKVESVREYDEETIVESTDIIFKATIRSGKFSGRNITAVQTIDGFSYIQQKEVQTGDEVILSLTEVEESEYEWQFIDYLRSDKLIYLGILFVIVLIIFGRLKGLNTILSLIFTCLAIFSVFIPAILSGRNIYLWSVLTCVYIILSTLLIVSGFNRKTLAAIAGCFAGIVMTASITLLMDNILILTGFLDENSLYIVNLPLQNTINLRGLVFAAIIIGAMGAIMDVSVSIASSLWEIKSKVKSAGFNTLYSSGINIGRDIMGTMSNTLILAYIGGALSLVILLTAYSTSPLELFNREMIIAEVLKALTGSFGILLTMPLTALVSGFLYTRIFKN